MPRCPVPSAVTVAGLALLAAAGCQPQEVRRPVLKNSPVRITEIHFHPTLAQGDKDAEFVEVTNVSSSTADLSGWTLDGVGSPEPRFPPGTRLAAGESVVMGSVESDVRALSGYDVPFAGTFEGSLDNAGETVRVIDAQGRIADEVTWSPQDTAAAEADGTGKSIQRGIRGGPWKAAEPTPGRT